MGALIYALAPSVIWLVVKLMRIGRRETYLPNGPPTVPLLGNLNIFPKFEAHLKLTEWARTYGGIYSLKMGPGTVIVLTDTTIVKELIDQHSHATVDRPPMHVTERVNGGMSMILARYGEEWRKLRRAAQETLSQNACAKHIPIQRAESAQVLHDVLADPKGCYTHLRRYSASVILSVLYGKRAPRFETKEVSDFFEMEQVWEELVSPGGVPPVDFLPFLKYLPPLLAPWKIKCETTRRLQRKLYFGLLSDTEERVAQGRGNGSFIEQVLARQVEFRMSRELIGYLAGIMIEAGADTTSSWLQSLVLGVAAFPETQKKAQAELDRVVGRDRIPTLEDLPDLPYIQATIKECHRWRPPAPLGVPHATIEEINYRGFRIPIGTTIFINTWGISHDPDVYERPEDFWPDRWISPDSEIDKSDLRDHTWFGSGRRFCPGVHLAVNSLAINAMSLLWAFNFGPEIEQETGKPLPLDIFNYDEGLGICPAPFVCTITPRSAHHVEVIEQEFAAAEGDFAPYEHGLSEEDRAFVEAQRK